MLYNICEFIKKDKMMENTSDQYTEDGNDNFHDSDTTF